MCRQHLAIASFLLAAAPIAQANVDGAQLSRIQSSVLEFVQTQSSGLPGRFSAQVGAIDTRLSLAPCLALESFLPPDARLWGNTTIGVRCSGNQPWTIYVPVQVKIMGLIVVANRPVPHGRTIDAADLSLREADLGQLPPAVIRDPEEAVGRIASARIAPGQPVRRDLLRTPIVEQQQGRSVPLFAEGASFKISVAGKAVASAPEGQLAQARLPTGQSVNGIAGVGGLIEAR